MEKGPAEAGRHTLSADSSSGETEPSSAAQGTVADKVGILAAVSLLGHILLQHPAGCHGAGADKVSTGIEAHCDQSAPQSCA